MALLNKGAGRPCRPIAAESVSAFAFDVDRDDHDGDLLTDGEDF